MKLIPLGAVQFLKYPLVVGLPIYTFSVLQSGIDGIKISCLGGTYYDEYDGDVKELAAV